MSRILLEAASGNLLLGYMPEPLGLLLFGIVLIILAIGLRRIFNRDNHAQNKESNKKSV